MERQPSDTVTDMWDKYFLVRLPTLLSRGVDHIKTYGVILSGIKAIDNSIPSQCITTRLPLAILIRKYKEGCTARVVHRADVGPMYNILTEYLTFWYRRLEFGVNVGDAPYEWLILADKFASMLYQFARYEYGESFVKTSLMGQISELKPINAGNLFRKGSSTYNSLHKVSESEEPLPEREGYDAFFQGRLLSARRYL